MDEDRQLPKRPWDSFRELPVIEDELTSWKQIKVLRILSLCVTALMVFALALCSKTSFLLLITMASDGAVTLAAQQKPVALLCVGGALTAPSLLLLLKSMWKSCYRSGKVPRGRTAAMVLFFELLGSVGAAILTLVAMPHLDIVTNVTILNGTVLVSALLQAVSQCAAKERNRFLVPPVAAVLLVLLGYVLFLVLYVTKDPTDVSMLIWVGLAVGGSILVSFNWWENYFRLIGKNSTSVFLKDLCEDIKRSRNVLHMVSSLLRILVTACVLGAYVPLAKMDWDTVTSVPPRQTQIVAITVGVHLVSSVLCQWFAGAACKMHALRRCFLLPLYLASLAVMALLVVPVIVYYQQHRNSLNGTDIDFGGYCAQVVDSRNQSLNGSVFPELVLDLTNTLCFLDMSKVDDIGILTGSAVCWWLGLILATLHLWNLGLYRIQRIQDVFARRSFEGTFVEQSLLLNTRFDIQTHSRKRLAPPEPIKVFLCATMWHETYEEMTKMMLSVFRLDRYRPKRDGKSNDVSFEGHIYFDDAFVDVAGSDGRHVNQYAETLVNIVREIYGVFTNMDKDLFTVEQQLQDQTLIPTPYGGRLLVTLPHGNTLMVHFKDKKLIRHKKRWSQVMYLYYLLGWRLGSKYFQRVKKGEDEDELTREFEKEKHNTYILALDGDTDFQPAAVMLLVDRLKTYPLVGAACGRIHPTGSGPMVWYQKFEYAVGHWLHKTTEHVLGCVLCSPGCFSLFRAAALMDDNVMKKYTVKASKASQHIQYDQGEDRWLCTLLLKQGWRVEYNAAADAYTNAPEELKEFYNQRRRWGPSTMANIVDLLGSSSLVTKRNPSMSQPYMLYQLFSLASSILSPSTVVLMVAGTLTVLLDIHPNVALVLSIIPPAVFLGLSFKLKSDTQIQIAGVLSCIYAFLMMMGAIAIIGNMMKDGTVLTPSSIFILSISGFYLLTALLHPQEVGLIAYGLLYIISIPSAYLLLSIYSMVNMDNVSWGTRETPAGGAAAAALAAAPPQTNAQKVKGKVLRFFSSAKCCGRACCRDAAGGAGEHLGGAGEHLGGAGEHLQNLRPGEAQPDLPPQNSVVEDEKIPENLLRRPDLGLLRQQVAPPTPRPHQSWVSQLQSLSDDMNLMEETMEQEEAEFFRQLTAKYLEPLPVDKKKQQEMAEDLKDLRNKITFVYFIINALWLVSTFSLQLSGSVFIRVPKLDSSLQPTGDFLYIDPLGLMFILSFALLVIIQFCAMIYHRIYTLIHFVAFLDTEPTSRERRREEPAEKEVDDDSVDSDDFLFPSLMDRGAGTLV